MKRMTVAIGISTVLLTACQGADGPPPLPAPSNSQQTQSSPPPPVQ